MPTAYALRSQIEAALADRIPAALTPVPRIIREVMPAGIESVDAVLEGGLPVGALTEMTGAECSGRTSLALCFVAQVTRAEKVCAWVDVSDALSPESAAACGVDLGQLLWVRCGVAPERRESGTSSFVLPRKYFVPPPPRKGLHGGGFGGHPRNEQKGMGAAVSRLLQPEDIGPRCAEPQRRVRAEKEPVTAVSIASVREEHRWRGRNPWERMQQAMRVTDLLLQAGGFTAVVVDLGGVAPEHVSRIPLATWFRYRAAAERTHASVVLLTQYPCAKSSAGLMLRLQAGEVRAEGGTVLAGLGRRVEVVRRRFKAEGNVIAMRKPPQRAGVAEWNSTTAWVACEEGARR